MRRTLGLQTVFALLGGAAVAMTGVAHVADRRRLKRSDPDRVGFMPWPGIAMLGTAGAILCFALALLAKD